MPRFPLTSISSRAVTLDGRELLCFGGCNYLGLAHHPALERAAVEAMRRYGLSTGASRETSGNTALLDELERRAAAFTGFEAAVLTLDGYTANLALARTLAADFDVGLHDARSHQSIREAIVAAGMRPVPYAHRDARAAAEAAAAHAGARIALFTDGVFAADGAVAPAPELLAALPADGVMVVDDCHGLGVLGEDGAGTVRHFGISDPRVCVTTTFAKAMGSHGGAILGSGELAEAVRSRAGLYMGTTPLAPPMAGAALEAFRVHGAEPERLGRLRENALDLRKSLADLGLNVRETPAPVFAFTHGSAPEMDRLHARLRDEGILAPLIAYPGGPAPCYFRLAVTAEHTREDIDRLITALAANI